MNDKMQGETEEQILAEEIKNEKIRRAMLAVPASRSCLWVPLQFRYGARKPVSAASTSSGASSRQ